MIQILKTFGLGLLCTILSPLILLVLILYFIYTLIGIIVMFFISVYRYFAKGSSVLDELEIDKKAKQILQAQEEYNQKVRESMLNGSNPFSAPQANAFAPNTFNSQNSFGAQNSYNMPQTNQISNQNNSEYFENEHQNFDQSSSNENFIDNNSNGGDNL